MSVAERFRSLGSRARLRVAGPRWQGLVLLAFVVGAACSRRGTSQRHSAAATSASSTTWVHVTASSSRESESTEAPRSREVSGSNRDVSAAEKTKNGSGSHTAIRLAMEEHTWTFQDPNYGRIDVVVVLPDRRRDERFPLLVALHGRGEAMKGPVRGARGWVDDYALMRAMQRLSDPPLAASDFEGIVAPARLQTLNRALELSPYTGLVVLCPYTPEILAGDKPFERAMPYARFLTEVLLPRARRELPVIDSPAATGIDGVSLGGRVGILSGLYAPEQFGVIAGLQAAFDSEDAAMLGALGDAAMKRNERLRFRFLTSDRDYFLDANQAIAHEFERRHHPVRLLIVPGPHDYVFNRGSGAIEMLFFHDRALRRAAWPE